MTDRGRQQGRRDGATEKDQVETEGKKRDRANLRVESSSIQRRDRAKMGEKGREDVMMRISVEEEI